MFVAVHLNLLRNLPVIKRLSPILFKKKCNHIWSIDIKSGIILKEFSLMLEVEPSTATVNIIRVTANKVHQIVVIIAMCSSGSTGDVSIGFALKFKEYIDNSDETSTWRCWSDWCRNCELGASWDIIRRVQLALAQSIHCPSKC